MDANFRHLPAAGSGSMQRGGYGFASIKIRSKMRDREPVVLLWKTTDSTRLDSTQLNSLAFGPCPLPPCPLFSISALASRPKVRPKPGAPCPRILIPAVAPVGLVRPGSLPPAVPSPEVEPAAHPPARAIAGDRDREEAALPTINPSGATGEDRWKMA